MKIFEKWGRLPWEVDQCDADFIDELLAFWDAQRDVDNREKRRAEVRKRMEEARRKKNRDT